MGRLRFGRSLVSIQIGMCERKAKIPCLSQVTLLYIYWQSTHVGNIRNNFKAGPCGALDAPQNLPKSYQIIDDTTEFVPVVFRRPDPEQKIHPRTTPNTLGALLPTQRHHSLGITCVLGPFQLFPMFGDLRRITHFQDPFRLKFSAQDAGGKRPGTEKWRI